MMKANRARTLRKQAWENVLAEHGEPKLGTDYSVLLHKEYKELKRKWKKYQQ